MLSNIIYINLNRRQDRRAEMDAQLQAYGLTAERFEAFDRNPGIIGCTMSHLAVIKSAQVRQLPHILILEDDFMFELDKPALELVLEEASHHKFDVIMLAYHAPSTSDGPIPGLRRINEAQTASAYIINMSYYQTLIDLYERTLPLLETTGAHWLYANDQAWKPLQTEGLWYAITPRAGKQRPGFSDNSGGYFDYDC
jgi:glycosyl transferase family 25